MPADRPYDDAASFRRINPLNPPSRSSAVRSTAGGGTP
jgi:hypothetical protein